MSGRGLTREHVVWAYRILLDRDPESEAVILPKLEGCHSTEALRASIITSREFLEKNRDFAHSNARSVVIKELSGGARLFVDLSDHVIGLAIVRDQYESGEMAFVRSVVRPGDHVLDIGAHIGFFAVQMAQLVGPAGTVTAFEPFAENAALLERSIAENGFAGRLRLEQAAVGRSSGAGELTFAGETLNSGGAFIVTGASGVPYGHAVRRIRLVALDDARVPHPIAFVKMDVEGAEPLVLEGSVGLLATDRPLILSELHAEQLARVSGRSPAGFLDEVRALGYRVFRLEGGERGAEVSTVPAEPVCSLAFIPSERC